MTANTEAAVELQPAAATLKVKIKKAEKGRR
jgi:hypothetical protein